MHTILPAYASIASNSSQTLRIRTMCLTALAVAFSAVEPTGKASFVSSCMRTRLMGQCIGKWPNSLVSVTKPLLTVITAIAVVFCSTTILWRRSGLFSMTRKKSPQSSKNLMRRKTRHSETLGKRSTRWVVSLFLCLRLCIVSLYSHCLLENAPFLKDRAWWFQGFFLSTVWVTVAFFIGTLTVLLDIFVFYKFFFHPFVLRTLARYSQLFCPEPQLSWRLLKAKQSLMAWKWKLPLVTFGKKVLVNWAAVKGNFLATK